MHKQEGRVQGHVRHVELCDAVHACRSERASQAISVLTEMWLCELDMQGIVTLMEERLAEVFDGEMQYVSPTHCARIRCRRTQPCA